MVEWYLRVRTTGSVSLSSAFSACCTNGANIYTRSNSARAGGFQTPDFPAIAGVRGAAFAGAPWQSSWSGRADGAFPKRKSTCSARSLHGRTRCQQAPHKYDVAIFWRRAVRAHLVRRRRCEEEACGVVRAGAVDAENGRDLRTPNVDHVLGRHAGHLERERPRACVETDGKARYERVESALHPSPFPRQPQPLALSRPTPTPRPFRANPNPSPFPANSSPFPRNPSPFPGQPRPLALSTKTRRSSTDGPQVDDKLDGLGQAFAVGAEDVEGGPAHRGVHLPRRRSPQTVSGPATVFFFPFSPRAAPCASPRAAAPWHSACAAIPPEPPDRPAYPAL